jgi:hypothetical protein
MTAIDGFTHLEATEAHDRALSQRAPPSRYVVLRRAAPNDPALSR